MGVGLRPKARALREGNKTLGRAPVQVPPSLSRAWRSISFLKTPRQYLKCSKPSKFAITLLSFPPPQPYPSLKRLADVSARPENPREVLGSSRSRGASPTARRRIRLVPILAVSEQSRRFVRRSSVFTTLRCMIFLLLTWFESAANGTLRHSLSHFTPSRPTTILLCWVLGLQYVLHFALG